MIVSSMGSWMHEVGAGWLMATLTSDPFMVSMVQAAATLPLFLLTMPAGALADITDRRIYLIGTQFWLITTAGILGILTLMDITTAKLLLMFSFSMGVGTSLMMPAFASLTPELVPKRELAAAITLNSIAFNITRAVGPAVAGLLVAAAGPGIVFILNAISFTAVITVIYRWENRQPASHLPNERFIASMRSGLRYFRQASSLHAIILRGMALFAAMSAPLAFLPLIVREELQSGPETYGLLLGCIGIGAVVTGFSLAKIRQRFSADAIIAVGTTGVVITTALLASVRDIRQLVVIMAFLGASWIAAQSTLQVSAQLSLPRWVRARGLAVFMATFMGIMALGAITWGNIAAMTSIQMALSAAAATGAIGIILTLPLRLERFADADPSPAEPGSEPVADPMAEPGLAMPSDNEQGSVLINIEYKIDPAEVESFLDAMGELRKVRLRNGSMTWGIYQDRDDDTSFVETYLDESWLAHLRQRYRVTQDDRRAMDAVLAFHRGTSLPLVTYLQSRRRRKQRNG